MPPKSNKTAETTLMLTTPADLPMANAQSGAVADPAAQLQFEHLKKMFDEIYSKADVEVKTDINAAQIIALSKGLIYAGRYKNTMMAELCQTVMTLSISKDRKSRGEFTKIAQGVTSPQMPIEERPTLRRRLMGDQ